METPQELENTWRRWRIEVGREKRRKEREEGTGEVRAHMQE